MVVKTTFPIDTTHLIFDIMPIDNEKPVSLETLQREVAAMKLALSRMTGAMVKSTDAKVREGAKHLYAELKK